MAIGLPPMTGQSRPGLPRRGHTPLSRGRHVLGGTRARVLRRAASVVSSLLWALCVLGLVVSFVGADMGLFGMILEVLAAGSALLVLLVLVVIGACGVPVP